MAMLAVGLVAMPAPAAADPAQPCAITPGDAGYQNVLVPLLARFDQWQTLGPEALGAQYGGVWFSARDQGVGYGVAPGPVELPAARAALLAAFGARGATGDDLANLDRMLFAYRVPYAYAEILGLHSLLRDPVMAAGGGAAAIGISCARGDTFRVHVFLWATRTAEQVAAVQALVAPHGDRVQLELSDLSPPAATIAPPTRIRSASGYVAWPVGSRCVAGASVRIRVPPALRGQVSWLRVEAGGVVRWAKGATLRRGISVPLRTRALRVTVSVRTAAGAVTTPVRRTFRRCA